MKSTPLQRFRYKGNITNIMIYREKKTCLLWMSTPTTPALVSRLGGHKPTDGVGAKAYATEFFSGDGHGKVRMFETWVSDITDICCDISTG